MAEIQKKKRLRTGHRASATRLISQTRDSLIADTVSITKSKQLEVQLRERMALLKTLDSEIFDALEEEEGDFEQADICTEKIQLAIFDIEAKLKFMSKASSPRAVSPTHTAIESPVSSNSTTDAHQTSSDTETTSTSGGDIVTGHLPHESTTPRSSHGTKVKLPKIVLKTFDGNPLKGTDSCAYCGSAHSSNSCNTVTDVDSRKQVLRKAGKCFNCLKRHHTCRECRSSMRCSNCRGKHHPSICHKSSDHSTTQKEIPSMTSSYTSTSMYTDVNTPVLLQTARAVVLNPDDTNQCMTVRILFDGGSQHSYITDHVKRSLGLSAEAVESVLIKTFGNKTDHTQLCDIVKLLMRMKNGETLKLSLLSVPFICDPVAIETLQYVICNHPHLRDLELADPSEAEPPIGIDILIGADNYWNLVTGMIIRHEDAPTAIVLSIIVTKVCNYN